MSKSTTLPKEIFEYFVAPGRKGGGFDQGNGGAVPRFDRRNRFHYLSDVLPLVHLPPRALTCVKRPEPIDIAWGPTRPSCEPPRMAASRSPIALLPPEPCRSS